MLSVFSSFHLRIVRSDWSDWQAHPVSAVCLFCDHQSETLEQIYAHMKVRERRSFREGKYRFLLFIPETILQSILGERRQCTLTGNYLLPEVSANT